ncbi:MAG: hypothetical protein J4N96_07115, partial [Chloroflexi bacterium]|nr:hypothetical protein [Chloroflexota bacterium]
APLRGVYTEETYSSDAGVDGVAIHDSGYFHKLAVRAVKTRLRWLDSLSPGAGWFLGTASIIGRAMRYSATPAVRRTFRLADQFKRTLPGWLSVTATVISIVSAVITLIGNGIFGTDAGGDSETEPA